MSNNPATTVSEQPSTPSPRGDWFTPVFQRTPWSLSSTAKVVLWTMACEARPLHYQEVADLTGLSVASVYVHLGSLVDAGVVARLEPLKSGRYEVTPVEGWTL